MNTEKIAELDLLSTNELLNCLGKEILRGRLGMKAPEDPEKSGADAFKNYSRSLKSKICQNLVIQEFLCSKRTYTRVQIAAAIADSITGYLSGISLLAVSVLIAREGISAYCECEEDA
ncbi:MAG: hypothetical protein IM539_17240 [Pseudanabaena sp. M046S1SP1A06QC]|nr:hypothetical protein [Pseudanabaena sp. M046S1SP1A06QC]